MSADKIGRLSSALGSTESSGLPVCVNFFSLGVTAEVQSANTDFISAFLKGVGQFGPNFHVVGDVAREPSHQVKCNSRWKMAVMRF